MPDLLHALHGRDLGHLRIVASLWGLELAAVETEAAGRELASALLEMQHLRDTLEVLPGPAREALGVLLASGGRMPWAAFCRRFGQLQDAGPGRRDREQVFRKPTSVTEMLHYRALLERAFFDTPGGPQEFAYIPDDLLALLAQDGTLGAPKDAQPIHRPQAQSGRAALPKEREHPLPRCDRLVDDSTTLLAALRTGLTPPETLIPVGVVTAFLEAAGILEGGAPCRETARAFLEAERPAALELIRQAWQASESFNELRQLPGLVCEGEWNNQPLAARRFALRHFEATPAGRWWSLPALVSDIKQGAPDFQRPAGDYDSWFIRRQADGSYLRGFASWDEVDGALLRYYFTGPLHWLGSLQLATPEGSQNVTAFRRGAEIQERPPSEGHRLHVSSQGRILVPRLLSRAVRYQIARFCDWEAERPDEYRYQVTTESLQRAGAQGLKVSQLLSLLARNAAAEIPPAFIKALKRWERNGTEARLETQTVLRVSRPEVLEELRRSKAGRFLGEPLGPVTVVVKPGAQGRVLSALAELGLLAEERANPEAVTRRK